MSLKPFSAIAHFFDYYDDEEHKESLDYLTHIIMSYYYVDKTSKELSFFPNMLSLFSVEDLFKFIEFFPDCRIAIPSISKLKQSREIAYGYYLLYIKNEVDIWNYHDDDMQKSLGEMYPNNQDKLKFMTKVSKLKELVLNSRDLKYYFESLDDCSDVLFQTNLFILSTYVFYGIFYERGGKIINFFPDIINFFGFGVVEKLLKKYQSKGSSIIIKIPDLEKLRFLVTVILSYYRFYHLGIDWKKIKETMPFYVDKPKKILSSIKNMHKRIEEDLSQIFDKKD